MKAPNAFRLAATLLAVFAIAGISVAQQGYKKPPKEVLDILNAPVTPGISVSPTRDNIILTTRSALSAARGSVAADVATRRPSHQSQSQLATPLPVFSGVDSEARGRRLGNQD